ncbi:hypothetical protein ACT3SP_14230 [Brachybacterium sp. AOP43-C2-M15]|uniref:hypothetical protein n=1 Tax=Brachybacterium sp. AOP43-C2-M15 TaxID=3457661 RepID=UPI00403322BD
MSRRRFLHLAASVTAAGLLATSCGPRTPEENPMDADQILAEAGFESPDLETEVADGPAAGDEAWNKIVTFTGTAEQVDTWVDANFSSGIESRAYRDDMEIAAAQLGEGVQKKGDRIASGTHRAVAFVVVVGQEAEPAVHVAVRRTGR